MCSRCARILAQGYSPQMLSAPGPLSAWQLTPARHALCVRPAPAPVHYITLCVLSTVHSTHGVHHMVMCCARSHSRVRLVPLALSSLVHALCPQLLAACHHAPHLPQGEIDERSFLTADYAGLASPRAGGVSAVVGVGVGGPAPLGAAAVTAGTGMGGSSTGAGTNGAAAMASLLGHQGAAAAASPAAPTPPGGVMTIKPPLAPAGTMAQRALQLGLSSPLPLMYLGPPGPATPISSALGAVAWLRSLLRDRGAEPGPGLRRLLEAAGGDAGAALLPRVQAAAAAVFAAEDGTAGAAAGVVVQPITGAAAGALQGVLLERSSEVREACAFTFAWGTTKCYSTSASYVTCS
jgi:hypothetical protein